MFQLHTAGLHQFMRSTGDASSFRQDAPLWLVGFQQPWLLNFDPRCFHVLCRWQSTVIQFCCCFVSWLWASILPEFLFHYPCWCCQVKNVYHLFDPACVPMQIRISKLYLIPKWVVSHVVSVCWNGGGLGMTSGMPRSCSLILSCVKIHNFKVWVSYNKNSWF